MNEKSIDLIDYKLFGIPDWVFKETDITSLDVSSEPDDPYHTPLANRILLYFLRKLIH